ncbi:hypothetical protein EDB81DRAFT_407745 [Dactylonectria macrodidyma]|uniref:Extracellular serine-rich protein n=1 Tax=Dactylonectria macrodidyma TaxID=307937 RepID=A0A9P9JAJ9_9HYPO|nr:hypothetical protein EDB81DRAFT_407745 [Dactylonectria macrodidyma]
MYFSSLFAMALLGVAQAVDVQVVSVGKSATNATGLKFWPESITAAVGTMVQFQFWVGNHTVTQSNFDNPCIPISNINSSIQGIYSGYQPVAASAGDNMIPTYTITISDEKPLWIFCSQATHCQGGMSMVINENTAANSSRSLANYKTLAESATGSNIVPGESSGDDSSSGDNGDNTSGDSTSGSGSDGAIQTPGTTPTAGSPAATDSTIIGGASTLSSPTTLLLAIAVAFLIL